MSHHFKKDELLPVVVQLKNESFIRKQTEPMTFSKLVTKYPLSNNNS